MDLTRHRSVIRGDRIDGGTAETIGKGRSRGHRRGADRDDRVVIAHCLVQRRSVRRHDPIRDTAGTVANRQRRSGAPRGSGASDLCNRVGKRALFETNAT